MRLKCKVKKFLPKTHSHLLEEWDYEKNGDLRPEEITYGSGKKVWWVCKVCAYGWEAAVFNRTNKVNPRGCPVCVGQVATKNNNLAVKFPELLEEWDFDKNEIRPEEITPGSNKKVWWKCSNKKCRYEWAASICNRTNQMNPTGCLICSRERQVKTSIKTRIAKRGSLSSIYPHLLEEWDFKKNEIKPEEITPGSREKVWWECKRCGRSWKACVFNRTIHNKGCSICSKGPVSKISQKWLDLFNIPQEFREYYIKSLKFRVDGFDPKTNTIYEFLGDYWHGNPKIFSAEKINSTNKKSFGKLHQETFRRFRLLEKAGYKIIYIWEKDFKVENGKEEKR